jgi:hypothetical protein
MLNAISSQNPNDILHRERKISAKIHRETDVFQKLDAPIKA